MTITIHQVGGFINDGPTAHALATHRAAESATLTPDTPAVEPHPVVAGPAQLIQALQEVQHAVIPVARDLRFYIDDDAEQTVVKVVDTQTRTIIRQIPSEELLAIARALDKLQGLLIKQKA